MMMMMMMMMMMTISGLDVSTEYEFTVRGINNLGEGDFSTPPVRAITTGNPP